LLIEIPFADKGEPMRKNSFKEQFPDYEIIPLQESRWKWPLIWVLTLSALIAIPGYVFYQFTKMPMPTPNMSGFNKKSLMTLGNFAIIQSEAGQHAQAIGNFQKYFDLGGKSADAMIKYAESLDALGQTELALEWAMKATEQAPDSKAARFMRDLMEQKVQRTNE
jgi:tetratricopeptide (TPR) repeat protein